MRYYVPSCSNSCRSYCKSYALHSLYTCPYIARQHIECRTYTDIQNQPSTRRPPLAARKWNASRHENPCLYRKQTAIPVVSWMLSESIQLSSNTLDIVSTVRIFGRWRPAHRIKTLAYVFSRRCLSSRCARSRSDNSNVVGLVGRQKHKCVDVTIACLNGSTTTLAVSVRLSVRLYETGNKGHPRCRCCHTRTHYPSSE